MRMGADLDRIYFIEKVRLPDQKLRPFNPATDMPELVETANSISDIALLILDPAIAVMPTARNSHNKAESRNAMQPVLDFAEASNAAVIGIEHLTKGTAGKDPLERLNGSIAFGGIARVVMGAVMNKAGGEDEPERIFMRIKNNIGPSGGGFGYSIEAGALLNRPGIEATRIAWGGRSQAGRLNCLNTPNRRGMAIQLRNSPQLCNSYKPRWKMARSRNRKSQPKPKPQGSRRGHCEGQGP